jgi:hypothetical protein
MTAVLVGNRGVLSCASVHTPMVYPLGLPGERCWIVLVKQTRDMMSSGVG